MAIGEATKTLSYVMNGQKTYVAQMRWGSKTDTADITGNVVATIATAIPPQAVLEKVCQEFVGGYEQVPPQYSALKIQGKRACDRVRLGEAVVMQPRFVAIKAVDVRDHQPSQGTTSLEVVCGQGTYIRTLAEDIAHKCGGLACLEALERTRVGKFRKEDAISLDNLEKLGHKVVATKAWLPISAALDDIPAICLNADDTRDIRFGRCVQSHNVGDLSSFVGTVLCLDEDNEALAIAHIENGLIYPRRVFNPIRKDR